MVIYQFLFIFKKFCYVIEDRGVQLVLIRVENII